MSDDFKKIAKKADLEDTKVTEPFNDMDFKKV